GALAHCVVELDVHGNLVLEAAAGIRLLHPLHDPRKQSAVILGRTARGELGRDALNLAAVFEIVGGRLAILRDEVHHRRREYLADDVSNMGAAARPRHDQSALFKFLERIAYYGSGDIELPR